MLQKISSVFVVYRCKTLTGSPDPTHAIGTDKPCIIMAKLVVSFLGGLSLHLNHLIASRTANYDWPFGTLPFELFGSNLDTRHLETYPRTYSGHFCNMSIFDDSMAFSKNGWSQKIKVFLMKERSLPPYRFSFRRRGP